MPLVTSEQHQGTRHCEQGHGPAGKRPHNSKIAPAAEHAHQKEARQAEQQRFQRESPPLMSPVPRRALAAAGEQGPHAPAARDAPRLSDQHARHADAIKPLLHLCSLLTVRS